MMLATEPQARVVGSRRNSLVSRSVLDVGRVNPLRVLGQASMMSTARPAGEPTVPLGVHARESERSLARERFSRVLPFPLVRILDCALSRQVRVQCSDAPHGP